jgi:hypothetical protein
MGRRDPHASTLSKEDHMTTISDHEAWAMPLAHIRRTVRDLPRGAEGWAPLSAVWVDPDGHRTGRYRVCLYAQIVLRRQSAYVEPDGSVSLYPVLVRHRKHNPADAPAYGITIPTDAGFVPGLAPSDDLLVRGSQDMVAVDEVTVGGYSTDHLIQRTLEQQPRSRVTFELRALSAGLEQLAASMAAGALPKDTTESKGEAWPDERMGAAQTQPGTPPGEWSHRREG